MFPLHLFKVGWKVCSQYPSCFVVDPHGPVMDCPASVQLNPSSSKSMTAGMESSLSWEGVSAHH